MRESPPSFHCPCCGMVSYHPDDIASGYCGKCHEFTGEPPGVSGHPQHGDPLDRVWSSGGQPIHRSIAGEPMTMRAWMEAQNDPATRVRRLTRFADRSHVLTFWTGLWDPWTPGGGGFDTVHARGTETLGHLRHGSDSEALDCHRMLVEALVLGGHTITEDS